jgi:hypothetical protein
MEQIGGQADMTAKLRVLKTNAVEREIGEAARAAKLKLRFDKVARRLSDDLKTTLAGILPELRRSRRSVLFCSPELDLTNFRE